mgnify:CR=1 FL=1
MKSNCPKWPEKKVISTKNGMYEIAEAICYNKCREIFIAAFEEWRKENRPTPTPEIGEWEVSEVCRVVEDEIEKMKSVDGNKISLTSLASASISHAICEAYKNGKLHAKS